MAQREAGGILHRKESGTVRVPCVENSILTLFLDTDSIAMFCKGGMSNRRAVVLLDLPNAFFVLVDVDEIKVHSKAGREDKLWEHDSNAMDAGCLGAYHACCMQAPVLWTHASSFHGTGSQQWQTVMSCTCCSAMLLTRHPQLQSWLSSVSILRVLSAI